VEENRDVNTRGKIAAASRLALAFTLALSLFGSALAQGLPMARNPEEVGLSAARLVRLTETFQAEIDKGTMPGAVLLIARRGKVAYFEALGLLDPHTKQPMRKDGIFRLASMTKPFVSVAAMMLAEEGKLVLSDPVSRFLPELKSLSVGVEQPDGGGQVKLVLEPVRREMTIQDLLRHTSGLTYGQFGARTLVKAAYLDSGIANPQLTSADFIERLSKLPLAHQPGTTWDYSVSTDVLGRVVEVVSGQDLDTFIRERISKPLRLPDMGFSVAAQHHGRIAESHFDKKTGERLVARNVRITPPRFGGGGGMVGTASDYARFCQFLLNGGELDGLRLVSKQTVASMTSNHLPASIRYTSHATSLGAAGPTPEVGQGWGLGFVVRTEAGKNPLPGSVGEFYWNGAAGTAFWVDPKEQLIAIMMIQAPGQQRLRALMRQLVYQAISSLAAIRA
jgi:CubicO group peptidase (beta-lactamase class C family)